MNESVIIIGAGGHGKVVADIVTCSGDRVLGFLDDNHSEAAFAGFPILGGTEDFRRFSDASFVIAVGSAAVRERLAEKIGGARLYTAIHPRAVISALDTQIGEGTVIMANAVVNPGAKIGRHCIVNTAAVVEHDNLIDDFVHISVGAHLAGTVTVGKATWVGVGATVSNNLSVCGGCMIGAGAVVVRDITESGTYVGVPAVRKR